MAPWKFAERQNECPHHSTASSARPRRGTAPSRCRRLARQIPDWYTGSGCFECTASGFAHLSRLRRNPRRFMQLSSHLRPGSSVVERGPEKAGVGGSIPSLATTF